MRLSKYLREFLESLNSSGIEYVIVGAHSLAFHGRPRYTGDLDLLVQATPDNAAKLIGLVNRFGFADSGLKETDFLQPEQVIQLGVAPNRVDLLTSITGVSNADAFDTRISAERSRQQNYPSVKREVFVTPDSSWHSPLNGIRVKRDPIS